MRYLVVLFIKDYVPKGTIIRTHDLYAAILQPQPLARLLEANVLYQSLIFRIP